MSELLAPAQAQKRAQNLLLHHQRLDVWGRVWNGIGLRSISFASPRNQDRRSRCENDFFAFLTEYFGHRFWAPTAAHLEVVKDVQAAVLSRSSLAPIKQAEAAPRSFGKTTIGEAAALWAALYHHRNFVLFIGSTGPNGETRLRSVKNELLNNKAIGEDWPEIVEALKEMHGGDPRRAPPDFPWAVDKIRLPNGVWIAGRGVDSSLVGLNELGVRPDFTWIDDVETLDTVRSATETKKIEDRLRLEVLRLHDINKPAAYFFICTIRARGCLSDRFTDRKLEPEWRGRRYKALLSPPKASGMWEKFVYFCKPETNTALTAVEMEALEKEVLTPAESCAALAIDAHDFESLTPTHQIALRYYAKNKFAMDEGAELLDLKRLPLHVCYHIIATEGENVFACEIQNDPPEDSDTRTVQLDVEIILQRRIGEPERVVPNWAAYLTTTIDVGAYVLHWEVDAWDEKLQTSCLITQGQQETNVNTGGRLKMEDDQKVKQVLIQQAIRDTLALLNRKLAEGFPRHNGELLFPVLIGVDVGGTAEVMAWYETVLRFCAENPKWIALKGEAPWSRSTADRAQGRNWICESKNNPGQRHDCNVDEYKSRVSRGYQAPARDAGGNIFPGARILHLNAPQIYAKHQTAEWWCETIREDAPAGKAIKVGWNHDGHKPNHWWDTAWMAYALADIFSLYRTLQRSTPQPARGAPTGPQLPSDVQRERF